MKRQIISKISEKDHIVRYGIKGMEVQKDNKCDQVFNSGKTDLENWESAVRYAETKEEK